MASKNAPAAHQKHLAVLIDADNAPAAIVEGLFEEIAKYGIASVKHTYDRPIPHLSSSQLVCSSSYEQHFGCELLYESTKPTKWIKRLNPAH
ncbi:hypothetical protein [Pseudomonas sp. URMO17WK12:I4]|uniref:hypothetical protein n=1 Tax=Pseudomonas sp. URMO17WK12:I4 TaxID=1283292 RepID=UPI0004B8D8D9|nr:hypothetical protein [Pseudomonas sp. URMO17WK12:I4]